MLFLYGLLSLPIDISVVIPCLNERDYIEACLRSLIASDMDDECIEIIVADGMSDDGTREIITKLAQQHKSIRLIDNPEKLTPIALNRGLKAATGNVKVILGAHSEVYPDFLSQNMALLSEQPEASCVGGILENVYEDGVSHIIGQAMSSPFGVGTAHFRTGLKAGWVDTVAFGAYRQEVFEDIGYFDKELPRNQDDEFNHRLLDSGKKIYLSPRIRCKYFVRGSFSSLWKQYYQYGYFKVLVNKKHRTVTTVRQLFPLFFVLYLMLCPLAMLVLGGFWLALLPLALYALFALVFAVRVGSSSVLGIIRAFLSLHLSYGFGYLKGIVDFLVLGKNSAKASSSR